MTFTAELLLQTFERVSDHAVDEVSTATRLGAERWVDLQASLASGCAPLRDEFGLAELLGRAAGCAWGVGAALGRPVRRRTDLARVLGFWSGHLSLYQAVTSSVNSLDGQGAAKAAERLGAAWEDVGPHGFGHWLIAQVGQAAIFYYEAV